MIKIEINRDAIESGKDLYTNAQFDIDKGITILVGKNGAGKTTLLRKIKEWGEHKGIPCYYWNNYRDGGTAASEKYLYYNDVESFAITAFASEGERIYYNIGTEIKRFFAFCKANNESPQIIFLLDAVDSGLDIEGIEELKNVLRHIVKEKEANNQEIYIIASANNYALVENEECVKVKDASHIRFSQYEDFKRYIIDEVRGTSDIYEGESSSEKTTN